MTKRDVNEIAYQVIGAAIEVHKYLGPGLMESTYQKCMEQELRLRKLNFEAEKTTELIYKGIKLSADLRCDLIVEKSVVVELKAVEGFAPVHEAQVLTYMKLLSVPKGLLINFNCGNIFNHGQKAFVNNIFSGLSD